MKTVITILLLLSFSGCYEHIEKPFTITGKDFYENDKMCTYRAIDKFGTPIFFQEIANKYNIGDTIK